MRPLTVITGIVLGSSFSVALSLAAVLLIFLILGDDYPRLDHEFPGLVDSFTIFLGLTAVSALCFYAMLKEHKWRFFGQAGMWLGVAGVGYFYWP